MGAGGRRRALQGPGGRAGAARRPAPRPAPRRDVRGVLDDPAALDAALRRWEHRRDRDTHSTYHWGNRETRPVAASLLVREAFRTFAGSDGPDASDTFNRIRKIERIIGPARLGTALVKALATRGADRRDVLREVAGELPIELGIRAESLRDRFRDTGWAPSERAGWDVGPEPSRRTPAAPGTTSEQATGGRTAETV